MKNMFLIWILAFGSSSAFSQDGGFKMPSKCIMSANQQLMDYGMGYDPDGSSLYFDTNGKTVLPNQDKIVKRNLENGVETITYKTKQPKFGGYMMGQPIEYETVERTVVITRDSKGRLTGISKQYDTTSQIKMSNDVAKSGYKRFPIVKSVDSEFSYNGDECSLNQTIGLEMENEKSKAEKKVYYDKKFCDQLAPMVKQIGSQNAGQCAGLISQAQMAFESRNKDLAKEGKAMKEYNYFGQSPSSEKNYSNTFNLGMAIQSCALADGMLWGYGMGMGVPMGYGMGMYGGGIGGSQGKPANTEEAKGVR